MTLDFAAGDCKLDQVDKEDLENRRKKCGLVREEHTTHVEDRKAVESLCARKESTRVTVDASFRRTTLEQLR